MTPGNPRFRKFDTAAAGLLVIGAYLVAAWNLAALSWDGSWYLFRTLQDQAPFTPHGRYGTYPVLWLLVRASWFVHDSRMLGVLYGVMLALIPVGALLLSWHTLRREEHAPLRIWPALGILLTPLPGQLCIMSEGTLVAQLLWPILAIIAAGAPGIGGGIWLLVLAIAIGLLHPTAVLIFALAAVLFGWRGWHAPTLRKILWRWAAVFVMFATGKFVSTLLFATEYERSQLSPDAIWHELINSLAGYPSILLLATYLLGFLLLCLKQTAEENRRQMSWRGMRLLLFVLALAALTGLFWASNPNGWRGVLDFRRFVLFAALPLVVMAAWHFHAILIASRTQQFAPLPLSWVSIVFAMVFALQSINWGSLLKHFSDELSQRHAGSHLLYADELPLVRQTPLTHWTASPLSILLQGRQPRVIFAARREDVHPTSVKVNPWEEISLVNSWFQLEPLRSSAPSEQKPE